MTQSRQSSEPKLSLVWNVVGAYIDDQLVLADAAARLQMPVSAFRRLIDSLRVNGKPRCVPKTIDRVLRGRQRFLLHCLDQRLLDELERIHLHPVRMGQREAAGDGRTVDREVLAGLGLIRRACIGGLLIYHRNLCRL